MTALRHQFTVEKFCAINKDRDVSFFAAELLYKTNNTEAFFKAARRNPRNIVPIDLKIFESAVHKHLELGYPVSINLNVETYFDNRLIETIEKLKQENTQLDYTQICLEITEQGKLPDIFDDRKLGTLKDMGFTLALDDFDPRFRTEWKRLSLLEDYVDIVKLPHEIMTDLRNEKTLRTAGIIREIRIQYPEKILIMEGFQETDKDSLGLLQSLGIDIVQESSYIEPKSSRESKPLALAP